MIRSLLKLGAILVVGILVYNYFFGDEVEREQSRQIFNKGKELVSDSWNLLKSEREKFREGKYDDAVAKVETLFANLKGTAEKLKDSGALEKLSQLEDKRREIESTLAEEQQGGRKLTPEEKTRIESDFDAMMEDTETLMEDLERKERDSTAPR